MTTATAQPVEKYLDVNLMDIIEYDEPETVPEWEWIEQHARWAHRGNGNEAGVWEFMVTVSTLENDAASIPATLKPFFDQAEAEGCIWIMFHQG